MRDRTTMTGGAALVAALVAHDVDTVFGIPGTHNLEVYRHLGAHGLRHVSPRHEQGAGYAADGYARTTGRPGVVVVTSGPALLNAAAAIGQAYSDSVPLLVVSPGLPLRHPALGNGLLHETRDQSAAIAAVAAASLRVTSVAEIPTAVAQAFALMTAGRPRPVHLEIPLDVLEETADVALVPPAAMSVPHPSEEVVREAAVMLAAARRPVVIAGGGARGAAAELRSIAERLGAPLVTTANGKGVLPEDHPCALGAGLHLPAVAELVERADVVLAVGTELAPSDLWNGPLRTTGALVRVDVDPVGSLTNAAADLVLLGDAARVLGGIVEHVTRLVTDRESRQVSERAEWNAAVPERRKQKTAEAAEEGREWLPVVDALRAALPRDAVVAADSAMVCYYGLLANLPTYGPATFLYPTGYGTLGYGLPAAVGAKVADPERPVVAVLGDGGVMFTIAELATAAALRLPLPVVVVDNGGYGEIRNEMADRGDPLLAVALPSPDFAGLGRALGCLGHTTDDPAALTELVRAALAADRPTVIHLLHRDPLHDSNAPEGDQA